MDLPKDHDERYLRYLATKFGTSALPVMGILVCVFAMIVAIYMLLLYPVVETFSKANKFMPVIRNGT